MFALTVSKSQMLRSERFREKVSDEWQEAEEREGKRTICLCPPSNLQPFRVQKTNIDSVATEKERV